MWVDEVEAPTCAVFSVDQPEKLEKDIRKCPCHTDCIFAKPRMALRPPGTNEVELWTKPKTLE